MSPTGAATTAPLNGGVREASLETVDAAHARLITARLPLFSGLWLGIAFVWSALHVTGGRLALPVALAYLAVMAVGFAAAILASRHDPAGRQVRWIAIAACLLAVAASSAVRAYMHGSGEVLGFSHLLLCLVSSLMFAWGWRAASVLAIGSFIAWWAAHPWLQLFLSTEELWLGYVGGSLLWIALAETSARSFRALWYRRQAERAAVAELEASRDAYRDLAENARDQIWLTDADGRIVYVNEAAAHYHGTSASDLVGYPLLALASDHPQNSDAAVAFARAVRGETLPPMVFQIAPRSGDSDVQWHEVLVSAVRGPDGTVVGVRGLSRDVTERVYAEEQLRESEERFRGAFASTSVGMTILDPAGRAVQLNDAICRMLGYSREELGAMTIDDVTHPDDRAATKARLRGVMEGKERSYAIEKRLIRRDGQVVWAAISVSPLRDAYGTPVAFIALVQDVTERRFADDALLQSHHELCQSEEKLRRLARQQTTIREEERKRLGLDLHDDVCQELVGMSIMVEALRRRFEPMSDADAGEFSRIARVADGLSEHLRLLAHELRPVQLHDLGLEGSLRSLGADLSTDACPIEVCFPTGVPRLDEETEVGIYRIAQEALTNAIRHARAGRIELMLAVAGEFLRLEVCDDGSGFVVAEGGDGFGQFSMEERASGLGGRLSVWSEPGEGTTVRLTCPVRVAESVDDEGTPDAPSPASMTGH